MTEHVLEEILRSLRSLRMTEHVLEEILRSSFWEGLLRMTECVLEEILRSLRSLRITAYFHDLLEGNCL